MSVDAKALVLKYLEGVNPNIPLSEALKIIHSRIELAMKINATMEANFKEWGIGAFVTCPECASPTLLEFGACHWCGYGLLDSTNQNPEFSKEEKATTTVNKEEPVKQKRAGRVKVQMNEEPAAILNFGGGKIPDDTSDIPLEKKGKAAIKEAAEVKKEAVKEKEVVKEKTPPKTELSITEKVKILRELAALAESKDTDANSLKEINEASNLGINARTDCNGKLSLFRIAIVAAVTAQADALEKTIVKEVVKKEKTAKPKADKKDKKVIKNEEDFEEDDMEEVSSPFTKEKEAKGKGTKVIVVEDEDFEDEIDLADDTSSVEIDDEDDVEAVDLKSINVDDLTEDDFDLDEEED